MASVVKEMPKKTGGSGRAPKFDYNIWLDGQVWKLDVGEDFQGKPESMRANINNAARKNGLKVVSRISADRKSLFVEAKTENGKPEETKTNGKSK